MTNYYETNQGFKLTYEQSDVLKWSYNFGSCGGNFSSPNGIITSPSYPANYPSYQDCVYTISRPEGTTLRLNFRRLDIYARKDSVICGKVHQVGNKNLTWDNLEIRDGPSEASPVLTRLCGDAIPAPIQSSTNHLWIK